jgi:hypothetical protein
MHAVVSTDWDMKGLNCGPEPTIYTSTHLDNAVWIEPYSGILIEASIVRAYSQIRYNTYMENSTIELQPFLLHHTSIKMSSNAADLFAFQLGEKASTRNYLMYIGYPLGGLLVALALFLIFKSCGCISRSEEEERKRFTAINDEDDEP